MLKVAEPSGFEATVVHSVGGGAQNELLGRPGNEVQRRQPTGTRGLVTVSS